MLAAHPHRVFCTEYPPPPVMNLQIELALLFYAAAYTKSNLGFKVMHQGISVFMDDLNMLSCPDL